MHALKRSLLLLGLCLYTSFAAGPFVWAAMMSLRTTTEIHNDHFGPPIPAHWDKFSDAWFNSNYSVYFANSLQVVVIAVAVVTIVGAMAAHCLARYPVSPEPRDLLRTILNNHLSPADYDHLAIPDPGRLRALQLQARPDAGLRRDPAAADHLYP